MTMPNFLILGAAKSGTTSLYHYLKRHPQIYMSQIKEPSFFAFEGTKPSIQGPWKQWAAHNLITDIRAYRALFQDVSNEVAIGEASTIYLVHPKAPQRIEHHVPDAKLITILRDPAERAYSDYCMQRLFRGESLASLHQAVRRRKARLQKNERSVQLRQNDAGFYYTHLKRYFDIFDRNQIQIYLYEDFKTNPVSMLQDVCQFLGADLAFIPDMSTRYMAGGVPRNKIWSTLLVRLNSIKPVLKPLVPPILRQHLVDYVDNLQGRLLVKAPPLTPEIRRELIQMYRKDILQLEHLIQQDLSSWLE